IIDMGDGVAVDVPANLDPTRRAARITLDNAPVTVLAGARQTLVDVTRVILAAEAVGVAGACTESAAQYAKERMQFGRPIAMLRATALLTFLDADQAASDLTDLTRRGVTRAKAVELPPEAEAIRGDVRAFVDSIKNLPADDQKAKLIESGYAMPHWPKPYGLE